MRQLTLRQIFAVPFALAGLTAVGLISALLGDGIWDAASWLMLGAPAAASLWYGWGARQDRG
jgi:hypothetical protein